MGCRDFFAISLLSTWYSPSGASWRVVSRLRVIVLDPGAKVEKLPPLTSSTKSTPRPSARRMSTS